MPTLIKFKFSDFGSVGNGFQQLPTPPPTPGQNSPQISQSEKESDSSSESFESHDLRKYFKLKQINK